MPIYEYQCDACGKRFEQIQKFSDASPEVCQHCGKGPVQRLLSSPAIQFKGSGWYITDYAKKSGSDAGSTGDNAEKADKGEKREKSESSSTSEKTESKPAATTETKSSSTSGGDGSKN